MSAKWVRSQQWDDRHLTGALLPVKWVLRTFSEVPTAIVLLSLVVLYGILASIPIGLIANVPTWAFYGLSWLVAAAVVGVLPVLVVTRAMRRQGVGRGARFVVGFLGVVVLGLAATALWYSFVWPSIRFDPSTGKGVRFFADFIARYQSVQARRLPGMEMSELEFYSRWPLRVVLLLFVLNLVTATVRRIEFSFPYIGVLMVHTGIVTIALGSVFYSTHKQEGDVLLLSGGVTEDGTPRPGMAQFGFYDNTAPALWVTQDPQKGWEQRRLIGVPRYNDYNLDAVARAEERPKWSQSLDALDIVLAGQEAGAPTAVDTDVRFRVVGYASYSELAEQWIEASEGKSDSGAGHRHRTIELIVTGREDNGKTPETRRQMWQFLPDSAAERTQLIEVLGIEYTIGMSEQRWRDLMEQLPAGKPHALVVEVPAKNFRGVYPAEKDVPIVVGDTGYTLTLQETAPSPPLPIVTKGYQGASSSLAIVSVQPPAAAGASDGVQPKPFERWVYHRFPEISQDMSSELNERGMPKRTDADPAIRIGYVDASKLQVYFDEKPDGTARSLVRLPGGGVTVTDQLRVGDTLTVVPSLKMRLVNAKRVEVPIPVPPEARDKQKLGNHQAAAIAVEVSDKSGTRGGGVHWVPFTQYLGVGGQNDREIELGDGRRVSIAFGRIFHEFTPRMSVRLMDFDMTPYPHSDVPRDYRSDVLVSGVFGGKQRELIRKTSLNEPLLVRTDFVGRDDLSQPWKSVVNGLGWAFSVVAPNQYKFSQAGWDQTGWRESVRAVEAGELPRPFARFTILGVGNNPGIYIIATGAVLMSVGIPWAFYLKPWIMRRRKKKIQEQVKRGEWRKPMGESGNGTVVREEEVRA